MGYGFRLFTVEVAKGPAGYTPLLMETVGDGGKQHYQEHALECLDRLEGWSTLTAAPKLRGKNQMKIKEHRSAQGVRTDPRIRFITHEITSHDHVLFEVLYGRVGRFPTALAVKKSGDANLGGLATGHPFRCLLMLPGKGKKGLLAVEDVDTNTPARIIPNWFSRASDHRKKKAPVGQAARSVRLMAKQVHDLPRLRALIQSATNASLKLTKKTLSSSGNRKKNQIKLDYQLDTAADRTEAMNWAEQFAGVGQHNLHGDGVVEMTSIVDGSLANVGFTDAAVVIKDDTFGTKNISAGKLDEFFIYPISAERPSKAAWLAAVKTQVEGMQTWLQVDVFDDDAEEEEQP